MKTKLSCILILLTGASMHAMRAEEVAVTKSAVTAGADGLRQRYVEGVRLISDVRGAVARTNDVLQLVEQGADGQVRQIADMEAQLQQVKRTTGFLETDAARRVAEGQRLAQEQGRLQERFGALARVLADERTLLTGATETAAALLTAADKSGKLAERRIADEVAGGLKDMADQLRSHANAVAQMQVRVKLESTLLQGLQPRSTEAAAAISAVNAEHGKLAAQMAGQRKAVDALAAGLLSDRRELAARMNEFGRTVETFRVVQLDVLRLWLVGGPPPGEMPALTIEDVMEGNEFMKKPVRPDPSATMLGQAGGLANAGDRDGSYGSSRASSASEASDEDVNQASAEVVRLRNRARWYFGMLNRLTSFSIESLKEANGWAGEAEGWRNGLAAAGRTLADQSGVLTTVRMQQEMATTTVGLISAQAETVRAQVRAEIEQLEKQTKRLHAIAAELKERAGK